MRIWGRMRGEEGAAGSVQVYPPCVESLEPRLLLNGDAIAMDLSPLGAVESFGLAIQVDLEDQEETKGEADPSILLNYLASSGESDETLSSQGDDAQSGEAAISSLCVVGGSMLQESSFSEATVDIELGVEIARDFDGPAVMPCEQSVCRIPLDRQDSISGIERLAIEARGPPAYTLEAPSALSATICGEEDQPSLLASLEGVPTGIGVIAPQLPGLKLVDPDISNWQGQIIYLDFDGKQNVTYNGPVTIGPFDVPAFSLQGTALASQEQAIVSAVLEKLQETFTGTGVIFTTEQPVVGTEYSTIYVGGDGSAFEAYGSFFGLAEWVDIGNTDQLDDGFVFSGRRTAEDLYALTAQLAGTIGHEVGHLLGYAHSENGMTLTSNPLSAVATEYVIDSLGDVVAADGQLTLREAIQAANTNAPVGDAPAGSAVETDEIRFDPSLAGGTIRLGGTVLSVSDDLHIAGLGPGLLAIDADGRSGVFSIEGTETDAVLEGLTLFGGYASSGAGLYVSSGAVTVVDCIVGGNTAVSGSGGGLYVLSGTVTLINSTVSENEVIWGSGGGLYILSGTVTLTDCTVSRNQAYGGDGGGGLYAGGSATVTLTDCAVSENSVSYTCGGGLFVEGSATVTLSYCTVNENTADSAGGLHVGGGTVTLMNSTVSANSASGFGAEGGGLFVSGGQVTLTNCTISRNLASGDDYYSGGGGLYIDGGTVTLTNSTISGNSASAVVYYSGGGGIYVAGGTLKLVNSIVSGNATYSHGGGIYVPGGVVTVTNCTISGNSSTKEGGGLCVQEGTATLINTIVAVNWADSGTDMRGGRLAGHNVIGVEPGFVRNPSPGLDGVWGTEDDDPGDLHLRADGFAVNWGKNELAVDDAGNLLATDRDGNPRLLDGVVDAGAYEYQGSAPAGREPPSLIVTSLADTVNAYDQVTTLREAIFYAHEGFLGSQITFSASLFAGGPARIVLGGRDLTIRDDLSIVGPGSGLLTIDAAGRSRVFWIEGSRTDVILEGLTVTGGCGSAGGGLFSDDASVTLWDCTVRGNSASDGGGGGLCVVGTATLTNCTVSGNSTSSWGGGLSVGAYGTVTLTNCTVIGNSATMGGGLFVVHYSTATLTNCTVSENSAPGGGGLRVSGSSTLILTDCTVSGNAASSYPGGGLYIDALSVATLTNSTVSGNSASSGGGILVDRSTVTVTSSAVSGNSASGEDPSGGGLYAWNSTVTLTNSTVSGNSASGDDSSGGGLFIAFGKATLTQCMIGGNSAASGGGLYAGSSATVTLTNGAVSGNTAFRGGGLYVTGDTVTLTNTTVSGNWASSSGGGLSVTGATALLNNTVVAVNAAPAAADVEGTYTGSANFIGGDPGFVQDLSAGGDGIWGTPDDDPGDLHLLPDSPCIDTGIDALAVDAAGNPLTTDLDGRARIVGVAVDIGAYEYQSDGTDLRVSHVSVPLVVETGGTFAVDWIVCNYSNTEDAPDVTWQDEIRLSTDTSWGGGDDLVLGTVAHAGGLAAREVYSAVLNVDLSAFPDGIPEGNYYALVKTDSTDVIVERDEFNNVRAAARVFTVGMSELILDQPMAGVLPGNHAIRYYRVNVLDGGVLRVALDDTNDVGCNELYIRYDQPSTRSAYDYRYSANLAADQEILISDVIPGTYHVMVYGAAVPDVPANYTITASLLPFMITSVSPSTVGNAGKATIEIDGARLLDGMTAELIGGSSTIAAQRVYWVNQAKLYASFDFNDQPAGLYTLRATTPGGSSVLLTDAVDVVDGGGRILI